MTDEPKPTNETTHRAVTETYPSVGEFFLGLERKTGELVGPDEVQSWLQDRTQAFTLREGQGYWNGTSEPVLCILIAGLDRDNLIQLGSELAQTFEQHSVGLCHDNTYTRILPVAKGRPLDQFRLSRFKQLLDQGVEFEALPLELQRWWKNRY